MGRHRAGAGLEHLDVQLAHAADAAAAVIQLAGVLLRIGDELREGAHRQARMHDQRIGLAAQDRNVLEVLDRVIADARLRQRIGQMAALRRHHQRVAVGFAARDDLRRDRTARAGTVVDDHRHAKNARQRLGILARHDVHRSAGREGDHQRDGTRRPVFLRHGAERRGGGNGGGAQAKTNEAAAGEGQVLHDQKGRMEKGFVGWRDMPLIAARGWPAPGPAPVARRWTTRSTRARYADGRRPGRCRTASACLPSWSGRCRPRRR
ncbi:hypothetical protein OJJOAM_000268 [Cupriavidus sp. H18C1]